jgi:general secretion pathway protein C
MSQKSKKSIFGIVIAILLGLLIAKSFWVALEYKYLPKTGEDLPKKSGLKKLYYHYSLASKKDKPKVVTKKPTINKPKVVVKKKPEEFTKFTLTGLYNAKDRKVIIVVYKGKSYALALNEELAGYKFTKLFPTYAIFSKNGKEYKLDLYKKGANKQQNSSSSNSNPITTIEPSKAKESANNKIEPRVEDGTTIIPKTLFNKYKGDFRAIRRNIDAVPNMQNGKLNGFRISFIRKGSDFDKLGLKRGDILTAINGEPLDNFKVPLEFFRNADSLSAATITIKRGNEIKELEYEVH